MLFEDSEEKFYYDKNNIIKCPKCNTMIFYINKKFFHECSIMNETFEINENTIKDKNNKFICDVNKIENMCVEHKKEFLYYKNTNYYCEECEIVKYGDFLALDKIELSEEEINNFNNLINEYENILINISEINENLIKEIKESYENFMNKNKLLLEYFKGLINFNDKYKNNLNIISTIRSISIDFNMKKFKNKINNDLIDFYKEENLINFNYYKSYFESENILNKGKYYLQNPLEKGINNALSIKDKKFVAIKELNLIDEKEFINEINLLKEMNECENIAKYLDSFEENNTKFIVTELFSSNLRNLINEKENGFSINEIKKIFCQINVGLKYLVKTKNCIHINLKPENILINGYKKKDGSIYYKYKLCNYELTKYLKDNKLDSINTSSEIIKNKNTIKSDFFNIGIILYELYYGNYENKLSQDEIINNIKKGLKIKNNDDDIKEFDDLKKLIKKCIEDENEIKWNEYFNHNFFNYEIEIILDIKKNDLNDTIKLINFDKFNNNNTELYIDDNKEPFKNEYKFNKIGNYFIKFIFKNKIIKSSLENMFYGCKNIKHINFNIFNTSNIKNMMGMFNGCSNLKKIDLSSFNTSNVKYMNEMFNDCSNLEEIDLSSFNTSNVKNMDYMFCCCSSLKKIDLSFFDTSNVKSMMCMFWGCCKAKEIDISSFDTSKVENMEFMFKDCCNLKEIDLTFFNTSKVKNMICMFSNCANLKKIDLSSFNTSNVEKMQFMFKDCEDLKEIDLSSFYTSNVKYMNGMFSECLNLKKIYFFINTSNVKYMDEMFSGCSNIEEINLSLFDTSNVITMMNMFSDCSKLKKIDLSSFNTSNVIIMMNMFSGCSNLEEIDLSSFNTSNVTNMMNMFSDCEHLKKIKIKKEFENDIIKNVDNKNILIEYK